MIVRTALLFPGQGSFRLGTLAGLINELPQLREVLDTVDKVSAEYGHVPVTHLLTDSPNGNNQAAQGLRQHADGPSHHGTWDASILPVVPGLRVAAPRDSAQLRQQLSEAVAITDGPTAIRFPKASVGPDIPAAFRVGQYHVLRSSPATDVLLIGVGPLASTCLAAADTLATEHGVPVDVVDPRWVAARSGTAHTLRRTPHCGCGRRHRVHRRARRPPCPSARRGRKQHARPDLRSVNAVHPARIAVGHPGPGRRDRVGAGPA